MQTSAVVCIHQRTLWGVPQVFEEPMVCHDGHTYERAAIERWLTSHTRSPMTNLPVRGGDDPAARAGSIRITQGCAFTARTTSSYLSLMVWEAATLKADPRQQQDWILKCLQGETSHPLPHSAQDNTPSGTLCCATCTTCDDTSTAVLVQ